MDHRAQLIEYIKKHSFQRSDTPIYKLSSGNMSNFYFNLKKTTYSPIGQYLIGNLVFDKVRELGLKPRAIGGLTMGADPIATATAYTSHVKNQPIEAMVIRKEPKGHGTMSQIEGNVKSGDDVIIIDDVVLFLAVCALSAYLLLQRFPLIPHRMIRMRNRSLL